MKISFFDDEPEIYPLQYGGKARTITNLAKEFAKLPEVDSVTILSKSIVSDKKRFCKDGVNYVVLDDEDIIEMIYYEMQNTDILNIHCCSFTFPKINGKAKKFYFLHDVLIATAEKGSHLDKSLGGQFNAIIAPSDFAKMIYENKRNILGTETKCHVIPRHINRDIFYKVEKSLIEKDEKAPLIIKEIIKRYKYILFFPNRPIEEKGGGYLKEIAKVLNKETKEYCIVGPLGNNSELPENFIDTGWIKSEDLKYYYSIADVTLNFSNLPESFSQICIESAYCGTPVVSFKSGNIPKLSEKVKTIILVDKNISSIIHGIKCAYKMKKDLDQYEMTKEVIEKEFATEKVINEYMKLYKEYMEE